MLPVEYFRKFRDRIAHLPSLSEGQRYTKAQLARDDFLLFRDGSISAYYVPFHHINKRAKVVLIGLTPGWTQMEEAFRAAKAGERRRLTGLLDAGDRLLHRRGGCVRRRLRL